MINKKKSWFWGKWAYWISTLFLIVIGYIGIAYTTINKYILISLLIISEIFSTIDTFIKEKDDEEKDNRKEKKIDKIDVKTDELIKKQEKQQEIVENINDSINNKKKDNLSFLYDLIENGIISENDAQEHLPSENIYTLYCFPTPLKNLKKGRHEFRTKPRKYPEFLKNMGFIRMGGKSLYYVISEDMLYQNIRDVAMLKKIIANGINSKFKEEWIEYLTELSKDKYFIEEYNNKKNLKYNEVLKASIILIKSKLNPYNLGFVNERTFNKEFYDLINRKIDLNKMDLPDIKKIQVKKFLFDASIEIAFKEQGVTHINPEKLRKIEWDIRQKLDIRSILDYANKEIDELVPFFKKYYSDKKSLEYVNILKDKSNFYKEALKELKIMA